MCIGVPMQVVEMRGAHALCEADGRRELVDMLLVGEQPPGTWILNFLGGAREVLTPQSAERIRAAITAVEGVMQGEANIDHLFADLIGREPQLPEHLRPLVGAKPETEK